MKYTATLFCALLALGYAENLQGGRILKEHVSAPVLQKFEKDYGVKKGFDLRK